MFRRFSVVSLLLLSACASRVTTETYRDMKISDIFEDGLRRLDKKLYDEAVIAFKSIDDLHPYSSTASTAQVYAAYALFQDGKYQDSVRELELFMKYNPTHELYAYAMYLRGLCFLKQVGKISRSQQETVRAKAIFIELIQKFPDSDYAKEANKMLLKLDNSLAAHEMAVGKHYQFDQKNPNAALGRYSTVVSTLSYTNQTPEALYRMIECYLKLGLTNQAENINKELNRLFKDNQWTKKGNKIMKSDAK